MNQALEVLKEQEEFTPEYEAYLRREAQKDLAELDGGRRAKFDAEKITAEERQRRADERDGG